MGKYDMLIKGALLHDIGKILYRADQSVGNHSSAGKNFLSKYVDSSKESKQFLRCIEFHHSKLLKNAGLKKDDWAYIVYEADNLASAVDRREEEGQATSGVKFDPHIPLHSIFHTFGGRISEEAKKYFLRGLNVENPFNYSTTRDIKASPDKYKLLIRDLKYNLSKGLNKMSCDEVLRFYEDITAYIPSSTNKEEIPDISLYMHSKITAALAVCMAQYFEEENINDFKAACFRENIAFRQKEAFMLVSGDFSGIQNFIYTIPSKGALKSLRGRSFYLEILLEHIIDSILSELELSRVNVLYTGGGHFYMILPAIERVKKVILRETEKVNRWLLENIGPTLYLAVGMATCTGNDFRTSNGQRNIFSKVSNELKQSKLQRYGKDILQDLFNQNSKYNKILDTSKECSICHTSTAVLKPYGDEGEKEACSICSGLFKLGAEIVKSSESCFAIGYLNTNEIEDCFSCMPIYGENIFLYVVPTHRLEVFAKTHTIVKLYGKNKAVTGSDVSNRLWLADYSAKNHQGEILEFSELAALSGENTSDGINKGIKRLGVLRADVDNLGAAFISGFIGNQKDLEARYKFGTLSRYADLSRDLSLFFKVAVNKLIQGEIPDEASHIKRFKLFVNREGEPQPIHIIYSGGDDVFMVGAWDALIEMAVNMQLAFKEFTQGKLTISAGLGLFSPSYPVSKMADITGLLESAAKAQPDKDSFALFGMETANDGSGIECRHVHRWDNFIEGVCGEKLKLLLDARRLALDNQPVLNISRSVLYKLMNLIKAYEKDSINLARILYTLARLEPVNSESKELDLQRITVYDEFVSSIYKWVRSRNKQDRYELLTALYLILYFEREKDLLM